MRAVLDAAILVTVRNTNLCEHTGGETTIPGIAFWHAVPSNAPFLEKSRLLHVPNKSTAL